MFSRCRRSWNASIRSTHSRAITNVLDWSSIAPTTGGRPLLSHLQARSTSKTSSVRRREGQALNPTAVAPSQVLHFLWGSKPSHDQQVTS